MKNEEQDKNVITNDINPESTNETWIIIGGEKKWIRKCPTCNKGIYHISKPRKRQLFLDCLKCGQRKRDERHRKIYVINDFQRNCPKCDTKIKYTNIGNRNSAEKRKTTCKSCQNKLTRKYETPDILKRNCPKCNKEFFYSNRHHYLRAKMENRICRSCNGKFNNPMKGSHRCDKDNPNYGKRWNQEQKKKARLNTINDLSLKGITFGYKGANNFNIKACDYFDQLNKEKRWNLQHALNGGEYFIENLGYWVDGYDKEKNIVVEYDERYHYINDELKDKDIQRMNEIINYLHCKFYRYNEKQKTLTKII